MRMFLTVVGFALISCGGRSATSFENNAPSTLDGGNELNTDAGGVSVTAARADDQGDGVVVVDPEDRGEARVAEPSPVRHWLRVQLLGAGSCEALVIVTVSGDPAALEAGASCDSSEREDSVVFFDMGTTIRTNVTVVWPSGDTGVLFDILTDQTVVVTAEE